jgi:hypothetical protein
MTCSPTAQGKDLRDRFKRLIGAKVTPCSSGHTGNRTTLWTHMSIHKPDIHPVSTTEVAERYLGVLMKNTQPFGAV